MPTAAVTWESEGGFGQSQEDVPTLEEFRELAGQLLLIAQQIPWPREDTKIVMLSQIDRLANLGLSPTSPE